MKRHTTINDLAETLKLSPSTVSRALRNHPDISEATKKRVLDMASTMHYQPNLIAQSLQNQRSNNIGVIVPEIRNSFFSTVISGIEELAYESGYTIMVCQSADSFERERLNIEALAANRVAGMLVSVSQETTDFSHIQNIINRGIPLVLFDRICEDLEVSKVIVDDFEGAYAAVAHLLKQGRTRIAHIGGTPTMYVSKKRREGYEAALQDSGYPVDSHYIIHSGYHEENGYKAAEKLMNFPHPPDALFCVNDPVAIGAFMYLEKHQIDIPRQVALVGFSNNPNTTLIRPQLTTVNQPAFEIGRKAVEILLHECTTDNDEDKNRTIVLPTELIIRESS